MFDVPVAFKTSDAAGCNWVAFNSLDTHKLSEILPQILMDINPVIDYDLENICHDQITDEYIICMPDMPHLSNNIVTAIELSGSKISKQKIKFGKCPVNLGMVEDVWLNLDGGSNLASSTRQSSLTLIFDKNAFSRMNASLAMQVLSTLLAKMIRDAISYDDTELFFRTILLRSEAYFPHGKQ